MRFAVGLVGLAIALASLPAAASPEDLFSYGPRSPAMGGTGAASSDGFEAAYTNPALLARIRRERLVLGVETAAFDLHADGPGLPGRISYEPMRAFVIGADVPIPLGGRLRDRIGAGVALSTPTELLVRGRIPYPETPQFPLLPDRSQTIAIRAGLGVDVGYGVRVGAGFGALAQIQGVATVATDASGKVGSRVEDQLVATYAPTFGASYDLPLSDGSTTRVGVTYRGTLAARIEVAIDATKLSSLNIPVFNIAGYAQYDPAQIAVEVSRAKGPWLLAAGVTWKHWSGFPGLIEPTIPCPADSPDCPSLKPPAVAYSDTFVPRAGAEYTLDAARGLALHLRAGAFFEPTPLPSQLPSSQRFDPGRSPPGPSDVPTRYFDASRLAFTVGYGVELRDPLPPITVDLFAQAHALLGRANASDAADTATGPVASRGDVSGSVLAAGLLAGVAF
jgi:long-chain fatty acid transport protein